MIAAKQSPLKSRGSKASISSKGSKTSVSSKGNKTKTSPTKKKAPIKKAVAKKTVTKKAPAKKKAEVKETPKTAQDLEREMAEYWFKAGKGPHPETNNLNRDMESYFKAKAEAAV